MPKRGENIRKRSDGRWEGRYLYKRELDGKSMYRSVYANSYAEVKEKLKLKKCGISTTEKNEFNSTKTFGEIATIWISSRSLELKYSTVIKYNFMLEKHILPMFGRVDTSIITEDAIIDFFKSKSTELYSSSLHSLLILIKSILKYAYKQGYCSKIDVDLHIPHNIKSNICVLSQAERKSLESFLMEEMDSTKLGFYLCLSTGLRIGELCALRWKNIDIQQKILRVTSTIQRIKTSDMHSTTKTELMITAPKSLSSIRDIPLPEKLAEMLLSFNKPMKNSYFRVVTNL